MQQPSPNRFPSKRKLLTRYKNDVERLDELATLVTDFLKRAILASADPDDRPPFTYLGDK